MSKPEVVSREQWLAARRQLLEREKAFTRERDRLSQARRELPWVRVEAAYEFETETGSASLADLFGPYSQLVVYHFMLGPDWEAGCVSCSFWADNFDRIGPHLGARDISFVVVSRAPLSRIQPFKRRMGWTFDWVSSHSSSFNQDYHVSFGPDHSADRPVFYNFRETTFPSEEAPGISVFAKGEDGAVYHTYSTYARGLDLMNGAYNFIDLTPKGRDEAGAGRPMAWLRHRDAYDRGDEGGD